MQLLKPLSWFCNTYSALPPRSGVLDRLVEKAASPPPLKAFDGGSRRSAFRDERRRSPQCSGSWIEAAHVLRRRGHGEVDELFVAHVFYAVAVARRGDDDVADGQLSDDALVGPAMVKVRR